MKFLLSLTCCFFPLLLSAQTIELTPTYPTLSQSGRDLPLAWLGGLNAPQTQATDLDGDGTADLFIFDKAGNVMLSMRGDGSGNYEEAPELVKHFPDSIQNWMILRDFDQDGAVDLFCFAGIIDAISVYKGRRRADGLLEFDLMDFGGRFPVLTFPFQNTPTDIFVSSIDYPSVDDADGDGDLDILTFSVNGGYVEYYQNQSVERGFGLDTLLFTLETQCWGGFYESGITTALDLASGPDDCFEPFTTGTRVTPRHSGSTVTLLDYDANGLMDVMLGDVSFDNIVLGLNTGTADDAWISSQDTAWNQEGTILEIRAFPAAFHVDLDQDGLKDIIGSPSITLRSDDVDVMWYYRNVGTAAAPRFTFQTPRALVDDMIDVGNRANVTTFDYDADGRPDLVIGNELEYTDEFSTRDSRLRLLRNVTPPDGELAFELIDEDYLNMSQFVSTGWAFSPAFGDLDGDGDLDVIIGDQSGKLFYGENTAGPGNEARFAQLIFQYQDIDAGQLAKPTIADLDRDGLNDLLVGGFDGRIRFYRNIGTASAPAFNGDPAAEGNVLQLGGINTNVPGGRSGHPSPVVLQNGAYSLLITGNQVGKLEAYRLDAGTNYTEDFTVLTEEIGGLDVGGYSNPGLADFNGDGLLEMVVGTERGGATFFATNLTPEGTTGLFSPPAPSLGFAPAVAPNPTSGQVVISGWPANTVTTISLHDITGRTLREEPIGARTQVQWNLEEQKPGVYLVRLRGAGGVATQKVVVR